MDFRYTTEQTMYRQAIREWLVKNLEPRARAIDEAEDGIPTDITAGMADLGMFGVTIPEEYGGMPLPDDERLIYAMITIQEIARADLSMSTPVYTLLTIGWAYIDQPLRHRRAEAGGAPGRGRRQGVRRHQHDRARRRLRPRRHQDDRPVGRGQAGLRHERREGLRLGPQGVREVGRPERSLHPRQDRSEPGPQGHDLHLGPGPPARHHLHDLQGHGPHGPVHRRLDLQGRRAARRSTCSAKRARAST